ncbi:uncharacterized protein LOC121638960 [Melanotaenia boesemani]|uniref:uncharacterized protein LOC121638960 n=1 Tax=Melanotaenia boesemani TaxID=1250792 RepID=UPI001C050EDB|nr:uncharacterized protein LOC121638960 [Melanotaenia boesemani]
MKGLLITLVALLGVVSCSNNRNSGSVTVRPGDNITLYCSEPPGTGESIVWLRNCTHENQPSLLLEVKSDYSLNLNHHFTFVKNQTSDSYDLLIINVTESDEGVYNCGTKRLKVEQHKCISSKYIYNFCNITTRLTLSTKLHTESCNPEFNGPHWKCDFNCKLLLSVCSATTVLSTLLFTCLVYHLCLKTAKTQDEQKCDPRSQTREIQGEDVCYAALEIRQESKRSKRMRTTQSSDFSTYSAIKTSQV